MNKLMTKATLALAGLSALVVGAMPASAADRHLRINNFSNESVYEVHITNSGNRYWGSDLLDSNEVIGSGNSMNWNVDDGTGACYFDFKFVMADGSSRYKYNYNVCAESDLNVVD
jgi:hypothetical protein